MATGHRSEHPGAPTEGVERDLPQPGSRLWVERVGLDPGTSTGLDHRCFRAVLEGPPADPVEQLLKASEGTLRSDVDPMDVLMTLSGICFSVTDPAQREQVGRMLDLLLDGLRYRPVS